MLRLHSALGLVAWGKGLARLVLPRSPFRSALRFLHVGPKASQSEPTEEQRLRAIDMSGILAAPMTPELDKICERAKARFGVAVAMVTVVTRDWMVVKARRGTTYEGGPRPEQFCDQTIRSDEVFVVPNALHDERFGKSPFVLGEPYVRFYAGAPIIYFCGVRLGALCLLDPSPRVFSEPDKADLARLAAEVARAIMERQIDSKAQALGLAPPVRPPGGGESQN